MIIEVTDLSIKYTDKLVVKSVSLHVAKGEFITIVGPNGCGKSTLLKALARILKPCRGSIKLWDKDIKSMNNKDIAKKIAVLPQMRKTPSDFDVETLIRYGRYPHGNFMGKLTSKDQQIIDWAVEKTNMQALRYKKLTNLSGGENQRAWIAMALAQKTDVIILDEPTTFLDIAHQLEILELLKQLNKIEKLTIVLVLHDLNQAIRYSDRTYIMNAGEIASVGVPEAVINSDMLNEVFQVESDFYREKRDNFVFFIPHKSADFVIEG